MVPQVFVCSTIDDLHHLRDMVRDSLIELEYLPVMAEYGEIGFSPVRSAEESCYVAMRHCQLAVLLIGKRYGVITREGISVTHKEFNTARDNRIPIISLIDREVLQYKKIFEANPSADISFPGTDHPSLLFEFIQQITNYERNNGIVSFGSALDVRTQMKRQIAHLVGELLRDGSGLSLDIKDILAELKTLRKQMPSSENMRPFLRVLRCLLVETPIPIDTLCKEIYHELEDAVEPILNTSGFEEFVRMAGYTLVIADGANMDSLTLRTDADDITLLCEFVAEGLGEEEEAPIGRFGVNVTKCLVTVDATANEAFEINLRHLRDIAKGRRA